MRRTGPPDLVTEYDLAVQRFLRQELLALLPEADFFGEEGQHDALTSPWTFIVDPIDGTTNFVRGFAYTNISVALAKDGQVEYAVVYAPLAGELYAARRGGGATLNGRPSTSADGIPATRWWCAAPPSMTAAIRSGTSPSCGISTTGDWTTVGSGRRRWICVRWRRAGRRCSSSAGSVRGISPPGSLLVQEAGGCVTTLEGTTIDPLRPGSVFAANALCGGLTAELPRG